jgi:hypothetical protein
MPMNLVGRMQKSRRPMVGSMARDTAQTKRAVDGILHLVHTAGDEIERRTMCAVGAALRARGGRINSVIGIGLTEARNRQLDRSSCALRCLSLAGVTTPTGIGLARNP